MPNYPVPLPNAVQPTVNNTINQVTQAYNDRLRVLQYLNNQATKNYLQSPINNTIGQITNPLTEPIRQTLQPVANLVQTIQSEGFWFNAIALFAGIGLVFIGSQSLVKNQVSNTVKKVIKK